VRASIYGSADIYSSIAQFFVFVSCVVALAIFSQMAFLCAR